MPSSELIKALAVTAELCGKTYSPGAAAMLAQDLDGFDERAVLMALTRCRKELGDKPFNVAAIIARIEDGRPGAEEAWAMLPPNEDTTVVWTAEMSEAWGIALPLLNAGDKIGARMTFKECYVKLVTAARDHKRPAKWTVSLGSDQCERESVLLGAVEKGRLTSEYARKFIASDKVMPAMEALLKTELKLVK